MPQGFLAVMSGSHVVSQVVRLYAIVCFDFSFVLISLKKVCLVMLAFASETYETTLAWAHV